MSHIGVIHFLVVIIFNISLAVKLSAQIPLLKNTIKPLLSIGVLIPPVWHLIAR